MIQYAEADATVTMELHQIFDALCIKVGSKTYYRIEWEAYLKERRFWKILDPTVIVPRPESVNMRK